jgi:hypothetical protein
MLSAPGFHLQINVLGLGCFRGRDAWMRNHGAAWNLSQNERIVMKKVFFLLGVGLVSLMAGCSSRPVALQPVGPNPNRSQSEASMGNLQVFSRMAAQQDDENQAGDGIPPWHQYTEYNIYGLDGKLVKRVINSNGHYSEHAELVVLPPGRYLVKAQASDYYWVNVPVTVERGRTTRVHLDDNWQPPERAANKELVIGPDGNPVGWRAPSQ